MKPIHAKNSRVIICVLLTIYIIFFLDSAQCQLAHYNNLFLTFKMADKERLFLEIENKSDKEQVFKSNLIGVLDLKMFDFPTRGYLQFRTDKADIQFLTNHEAPDWRSAAKYSSEPFPPAKVEGLKKISEIKIPAHGIQSFHIEYAKAIDITTVRYPKTDQLPKEFRIRLVINTMQHGKLTEMEIISEWFSCEKLMSVIKEIRN